MKKLLLIIILFIPLNVYGLEIHSKEVIVYDLNDDKIIYEKNSNNKVSIASLTKILTTITAIEMIDDLDKTLIVTENMLKDIYWDASVAGIKVGDTLTYRDLLYGAMLPSGADATQTLAISLKGNDISFIYEMNVLANKIGLKNSNFVNTTGLDNNNHYSTAYDIVKLLKYSLKNKTFKEIFGTREYYLKTGLLVEATIKKYNQKYNYDISRIKGSKTGYTDNAKQCLASLIEFNNHEIIIVTLGGEGEENLPYNLIDTLTLIDYIDNNYVIEKKKPIKEIADEKININYKVIIFVGLSMIGFKALVIPKKKKRR